MRWTGAWGTGASKAKRLVRMALSATVLAVLRTRVRVREQSLSTLRRGGVLLCANHVSFLDGLLVGLSVDVPLVIASEPAYAVRHPLISRCIAALSWLCEHEVVPLDSQSPFGMRALARSIAEGKNVLVFPEGAISPDGRPQPWRPGCDWIVRRTGCSVLPARISGAYRHRLFAKAGNCWWPPIRVVV